MSTSYEDTKRTSASEEETSAISWESLLPEEERLSLRQRSVVDAALSIADEVLGNTNTESAGQGLAMQQKTDSLLTGNEMAKPQPTATYEKKIPESPVYRAQKPEMPKPPVYEAKQPEPLAKPAYEMKMPELSVKPAYEEKPLMQPTYEEKPSVQPVYEEKLPVQPAYEEKKPETAAYKATQLQSTPEPDLLDLPPIDAVPQTLSGSDRGKAPRKKRYRFVKVATGFLVVIALLLAGGFVFINNMLNRMQYDIPLEVLGGNTVAESDDVDINLVLRNEGIRKEETVVPVDYDGEDILNFLLIGEEAIGDAEGTNGRSDTMIVLTVNLKNNTVKLTSFMRDIYLNIPGYGQNRLNAAFMFGGSELVEKTLNVNYGVYVDGYIKVNFDGFKKIINKVGGVEITLTEAEAEYLNSTNYIKEKKYRNVVPGTQTLNGSQALGYSRVRYVKGISEENDFGRTARQRMVLTAAYEKIKDLNAFDMLTLVYEVLPYITTNLSKDKLIEYAKMAISLDFETIESYRIPADGTFQFASVRIGNVPASIIMADENLNRQALYDFLYDGDVPEHLSGADQNNGTEGQEEQGKTTLEDAN